MRWTLLVLGLLLLLPLSCLRRSVDSRELLVPLETLSLQKLHPEVESSFSFSIPDDRDWRRARHSWGAPDYVIAIRLGRDFLGCVSPADLRVRLESAAGKPISTRSNAGIPYGYSAECPNPTTRFAAEPGSTIIAHVVCRKRVTADGGELIILPLWPGNVKDHIVGAMIDRDINPIIEVCALAGTVAISVSVWMFLRVRRRTSIRP